MQSRSVKGRTPRTVAGPLASVAAQWQVLRATLDCLADGVAVIDTRGRFLEFNPAAERMLGRGALDVPVSQWPAAYGLYLPDCRTPYPAADLPLVRALTGERVVDAEMFILPPQSRGGIWLSVTATPLYNESGEVSGSVAIFRDVTERRQAQQALEEERETLAYLVRAHERDRKLTAYELHDGLVQQITGALLRLEAYNQGQRPGQCAAVLDEVAQLLRDALDEARRVIGGLRPPIIDELGVVAALEYLVEQMQMSAGIDITLEENLGKLRYDPLIEATIYRIVQEALTNVRRHSQARHASVRVRVDDGRLRILVEDDGRGFDRQAGFDDRFGLRGIRERARLMGGTAAVESAPQHGTRIDVRLPLSPSRP